MESDDVATVLLKNSLRLFADAKLLYDNKRYPSAAALGVLCIEEFGKFITFLGLTVNASVEKTASSQEATGPLDFYPTALVHARSIGTAKYKNRRSVVAG
jgi:hypothetical protein